MWCNGATDSINSRVVQRGFTLTVTVALQFGPTELSVAVTVVVPGFTVLIITEEPVSGSTATMLGSLLIQETSFPVPW